MPGPMGRRNRGPAQKVENSGQVLKRLFGIIFKKYKFQMIIVFVCILISVLANVQGSLFIQNLIDDYITPMIQSGSRDFGPMLGAILRVAIFYAIGAASAFIYAKIMVYVTQGTMRDLRCQIFEHMESLPIKYFDTHSHGDIMSVYTNDIDTLRQMISQSIPQLFNSGITIIAVLVSMFTLSIPLTILTLIMVGVMLFVTKQLASRSGRFFAKQQADLGATNGYIEEMMNGQKVVKVFNHEKKSIEEFNELNDRLFNSSYNANKFANILMPINAQIGNISYVLCAIVGCIFALNNFLGFTIGKLVSFLTFNKSFTQPINQVSQQFNSIVMALAGADRIFKLLDEEPEVDDGYVTLVNVRKEGDRLVETEEKTGMWAWKHTHSITGETEYRELKGALVMDDVDFGYTDDKIVLHNIDLYAEPGQKIAFVGSTGAGKTTITNLINRFYDIQDGKIRYDGININKIKKGDLRRSLGIVLQDTHLFTDTVMEISVTADLTQQTKRLSQRQSLPTQTALSENFLTATTPCSKVTAAISVRDSARCLRLQEPLLQIRPHLSLMRLQVQLIPVPKRWFRTAWISLCTAEQPLLLPTDFLQSRIQTVLWFLKRAESSSVVHTNGFLNKRADTISFIQAKPHNDNRKGRVAKAPLFLFLKY